MSNAKKLDQFYTSPQVAIQYTKLLKQILISLDYDPHSISFLEPSAGTGAFTESLKEAFPCNKITGLDIDPKCKNIIKKDFLNPKNTPYIKDILEKEKSQIIVVGNPPFGKRSQLAIDFLNRSFEFGETVAFILPQQFMRPFTQRKIIDESQLIVDELCPKNSFIFNNREYDVRCRFQVWTTRKSSYPDLRIRKSLPITHPDFEAWIYNCTPEAEKYFYYDWDFAILRQGWSDFVPLMRTEHTPESLSKKKQLMFFKARHPEILHRLLNIDYNTLAEGNTSVKGFGKADIVQEYTRLYPSPYLTK